MNTKSSNPALTLGFKNVVEDNTTMSIKGTITKTFILLLILSSTFVYSWISLQNSTINYKSITIVAAIASVILGLATAFIPKIAQFTAVFYAACEGILLGGLSRIFENIYPGIVFPAIILTLVAVVITLLIYRSAPSIADKIRKTVIISMLTIGITYFIGIICGIFGVNLAIFGSGLIGIIFSILVVGIATLNLILDYDFILKATKLGAPKYMEWYSAFSLMVTLIWLYTEILKLLSKLRD
ncbi:Bax inhibitor-1/YccA family protein [Clostridium tarantellae]|uniref:Bax inhibitor-1/YccA family protein n=1 Tax=Clostridium tarantellae TaxID=39493 RepID=A0A6I1MR31_9CLOT|nr:Bax inhibitor-1/YccA family protein [Clostridium tarantellae]MPQ45170.1 hypothetical protein [Clostridium tarantellae]